jgi:ligand-binding sensor domain-containing protein
MNKYLFLLFFIIAGQSGMAQSGHIKFDHLTEKDGLPSNNGLPPTDINFIKQDDQGYIWIGTQNGLVRYDGYKMQLYPLIFDNDKLDSKGALSSMVCDKNKTTWFTIGNSLYRYNRSADNFSLFRFFQKPGDYFFLPWFLFADIKGNLWGYIKSDGVFNPRDRKYDLVKFDQKNKRFDYFGKTRSGAHRLDITEHDAIFQSITPEHQIWLGTKNGLYLYDNKEDNFRPYLQVTDTTKQKSVYSIYEAPSEPGILWMLVRDHLSKRYKIERFDISTKACKDFSHFGSPALTAANDTIRDIHEDKQHRLWFASDNGLMLFNRKTEIFTNYLPADTVQGIDKNHIYTITEAKNGALWLRCGKGVINFNPETKQFQRCVANPNNPTALSGNGADQLYIDRSGVFWVAINDKGVDKINFLTSAFTSYIKKSAESKSGEGDFTRQIIGTADGYIWLSDDLGIYKWKPGSSLFTPIYRVNKKDTIYAITAGKNGSIYFRNNKGLQVYEPATHRRQTYSTAAISGHFIVAIMQDRTGAIWLGTADHGIYTFNPLNHQFTAHPYTNNHGMPDNSGKLDDAKVLTIYEDSQGTIWIGTEKGGLNSFDRNTGKFKSYLWFGKTKITGIVKIYEDRQGRFWIGTEGEGLLEFNRISGHYTRRISEENGLLNKIVTDIAEDNKGFLWINCLDGLNRLDPRNMAVKTFLSNIILPGKSLTWGNKSLSVVNGTMVMGLNDGLAIFNPRDLDDNRYPPAVHIEQISYNDPASRSDSVNTRLVYGLHKVELPYNQNRITLNYVALDFTNPAQNRYAYTLEGYDNRWIPGGALRSATYTNLSPGTYTFRVRAANSDGVWSNTGDSFMIIIDTPFWLRWWAYLFYVILVATTIYAFIYYRSLKLIREKNLLEQQVKTRTEEVLQQKEEIEAQRDRLEMEKIRSDIAADFHDELGSTLSSIALYSEMAISNSSADERTKSILSLIGD